MLSIQLASIILPLLYKNQASFIPGYFIFDQTQFVQFMIDLAEVAEENSAIIVLNQEKAYNRIDHTYLWETLKVFNLPKQFIKTMKFLYIVACTQVMVNGVLSTT